MKYLTLLLVSIDLAGMALAADPETPKPVAPPTFAAPSAIAVLQPTEGSSTEGVVIFRQTAEGSVKVSGLISGLTPDSTHAIHVHEFGDVSSKDGVNAGSHFNPEGHPHGLPEESAKRHAGDLGNLQSGPEGTATLNLEVSNLSLLGENSILGRAVIVHEKADTGGQPVGDAGGRIAQGVIGIRNPDPEVVAVPEQQRGSPDRNALAVILEADDALQALGEALDSKNPSKPAEIR